EFDAVEDQIPGILSRIVVVLLGAAGFVAYILKHPRVTDIYLGQRIEDLAQRLAPFGGKLFLLCAASSVILAQLIIYPDPTARIFPRELSIPLILGGWIPLLSFIGAQGRRVRVPIIGVLGLLIVILYGSANKRRLSYAGYHRPNLP